MFHIEMSILRANPLFRKKHVGNYLLDYYYYRLLTLLYFLEAIVR